MATTITQRPYKYSFSENEAVYSFNVSDPGHLGVLVEIEIYYFGLPQAFTAILVRTIELTPDNNGDLSFNIAPYIKSLLAVQLPDPAGDVIQPVTSQWKRYYIRFRETTFADTNPDWIDDIGNTCTLLLGGVEQMKFKRNNFFVNYLASNKPFLTWAPTNKFVFADQQHFLTYLLATNATSLHLVVNTFFTDGTSQLSNFTLAVANSNIMWRINASVQKLGLDQLDPAKTIHYYEVQLNDQADAPLANAYRFYVEYRPVYSYNDFNFFNSLGGIDSIRLLGEFVRSMDGEGEDSIEQVTGNNPLNTRTPVAQFVQQPLGKKDTYKGDAGWSRSAHIQEALTDMFVRRQVYEWIDGSWIRVLNLKKSQELGSNKDTTWSFPLEWSYGYQDNVFTPKRILLGAGDAS